MQVPSAAMTEHVLTTLHEDTERRDQRRIRVKLLMLQAT